MGYNIVLVDDDLNQLRVLDHMIADKVRYHTQHMTSGKQAISMLTSPQANEVDLVLLDLSMPDIDGVNVLKQVKAVHPGIPVIVRSGYDDVSMVAQAMKEGAVDFIRKVDSTAKLKQAIEHALTVRKMRKENGSDRPNLNLVANNVPSWQGEYEGACFENILGSSQAIQNVIQIAKKFAVASAPIFITGEKGCGKEFIARSIHQESERRTRPFITIHCGAMPEHMVERLLFGYEKGAFTGAIHRVQGKCREADGGTLFLKNIDALNLEIQEKLLHMLQERVVTPVGSNKSIGVDVRVIVSSSHDLALKVKEQSFRQDLYTLLNTLFIDVPALRERSDDAVEIATFFVNKFAQSENKKVEKISKEAQTMLGQYGWSGNIKQLKNTIYRAVISCDHKILNEHDFMQIFHEMENARKSFAANSSGEVFSYEWLKLNAKHDQLKEKVDQVLNLQQPDGHLKTLQEVEKEVIEHALNYCHYHMSKVAKGLAIGRSTLYRKLDEYHINHQHQTNQNDETKTNTQL